MSALTRLAVLALLGGAAAACFSEHVAPTASSVDAHAACSDPARAGANVVVIRNFAFAPATVHVHAGETVTWVNCESGGVSHTSSSSSGLWKSGLLGTEASFARAFPSSGTFPYFCEVHPSMTASVVVQ